MNTKHLSIRHLAVAFIAAPIAVFAAYVTWIVVPVVVRAVVPVVVQAVVQS